MSPSIATSGQTLPPIKSPSSTPSKDDSAPESKPASKQIHTYHKLFWRVNMTLEFNIFYHEDRKLFEIAAYNSEKGEELEPLFLNEAPIKEAVMIADTVNKEMEKVKIKLSRDRFAQKPTPAKLKELAELALFNKFIEGHLNPTAEGKLNITNLPGETLDIDAIVYCPPEVEDDKNEDDAENECTEDNNESSGSGHVNVVRDLKKSASLPSSIERTTVVRRHRSSIHDFNKSLNMLKKDSNSLKMANRMTENLLNLSEMSVDAFKTALSCKAGSSKRYDKSTPLGRFRWAVHRVILQQYVEAVKLRIESLNNKKAIRINGTFPAPGSTDMQSEQAKVLTNSSPFYERSLVLICSHCYHM